MCNNFKHKTIIERYSHVTKDVNLEDDLIEMTFDDISTRFEMIHDSDAHDITRFENHADCFRSDTCDHLTSILALNLMK